MTLKKIELFFAQFPWLQTLIKFYEDTSRIKWLIRLKKKKYLPVGRNKLFAIAVSLDQL